MAFQKRLIWTCVAIVAMLMIGVPSVSSAQAQGAGPAGAAPAQGGGGGGRGRGAVQLYTPAPGTKDLKSVLFNWAWYMGMLRSSVRVVR